MLPIKDQYNGNIYGVFSRRTLKENFIGVFWQTTSIGGLERYGKINSTSIEEFKRIAQNEEITEGNIMKYIIDKVEYRNGGGYAKFPDGKNVTKDNGKYAIFQTKLETTSKTKIIIWFTKIKNEFEGFNCGDEKTFKHWLNDTPKFYSGRMAFVSKEECNKFYNDLAKDIIKEPWSFKNKKDSDFDVPILKSYLECELDRLFFEYETVKEEKKIIFNKKKNRIIFNTNLLDKFAHELFITGEVVNIAGKTWITKLNKNPSDLELSKLEFENSKPIPPKYFKTINEIIFDCEWKIDNNRQKYEHIIEQRIERFPEKYRTLNKSTLSTMLDNAINFAKKIAQRNYKFIVPMYYPKFHRIQLLMPIYMETESDCLPDFALVLTPYPKEKIYGLETILGLEEVYQDARLIAKPDESWLNPEIIK